MRNAQLTVWEHRPLTEHEVSNARASVFEPCGSCSDKGQPCLVHSWERVEKRMGKSAYILPHVGEWISKDKPFMLASLISTIDRVPLERKSDVI